MPEVNNNGTLKKTLYVALIVLFSGGGIGIGSNVARSTYTERLRIVELQQERISTIQDIVREDIKEIKLELKEIKNSIGGIENVLKPE